MISHNDPLFQTPRTLRALVTVQSSSFLFYARAYIYRVLKDLIRTPFRPHLDPPIDPQYRPHRGLRYPIRREREGRGQEKGRKGVLHYHTRYLCIPLVGSSYLVVVSDTIHHTMYHRYHTPYHTLLLPPIHYHTSSVLLLVFYLSTYQPAQHRDPEPRGQRTTTHHLASSMQ